MQDEEKRLRMAIIVGAAQAVRYKSKNPQANEEQIIQYITENAKEILGKIDDPL